MTALARLGSASNYAASKHLIEASRAIDIRVEARLKFSGCLRVVHANACCRLANMIRCYIPIAPHSTILRWCACIRLRCWGLERWRIRINIRLGRNLIRAWS